MTDVDTDRQARSSAGHWTRWHELDPHTSSPFGDSITYQLAAEFVADCNLVEDFGCGRGWLRQFIGRHRYRGIDGSHTPHADVVADLTTYRSNVPAVVIRHVLEHEYRWRDILDNAVASARRKLVVILFTPMDPARTHEIAYAEDPGVPDLSFWLPDLVEPIETDGFTVDVETIQPSPTQYGVETVLRCAR